MRSKELKISVPWGYISVKAWGDEFNQPVFIIHGLGDNSSSFDRLLPLLPPSFYYLCMDLPGHGLSSRYPPYMFITVMDNIMAIKLTVDHINRKKYVFMGHSWGGQTLMLFTQLYPEYFIKLILLDAFYLYPLMVPVYKDTLRDKIEGLIATNKIVADGKIFHYTFEEAVHKLINNRPDGIPLHKEIAEALATRALIKDGNKYRFNTDSRLKHILNLLADFKFIAKVNETFLPQCPLLIIYATDVQYNFFKIIIDHLNVLKNYSLVKVNGGHDVHANIPQIVAPIVSKFLLNSPNKL